MDEEALLLLLLDCCSEEEAAMVTGCRFAKERMVVYQFFRSRFQFFRIFRGCEEYK